MLFALFGSFSGICISIAAIADKDPKIGGLGVGCLVSSVFLGATGSSATSNKRTAELTALLLKSLNNAS